MPGRPYLLDNLDDDTLHASGLAYLLNDIPQRHGLSIATGYVNLAGLHHLAIRVTGDRRVRLLLGAAPDPGLGAQFPMPRFERALHTLAGDRDLARFPPSRAASQLAALQEWLQRSDVEVRRYVDQFLHGKAYLFGSDQDGRAALVTSANLTGGGLFANLELGLVHYDPPVASQAIAWFGRLWGQAADFKSELQALLFPDPGLVDPQTVYLRALLELFGDQLEPLDGPRTESVRLAAFQRDGFHRALRIVRRHGGVIYADGVGTGKTEIGLAFIEEYAIQRGHHALVVAPAQLVDYWQQRIDQARLPAQVISYQQLASDEQLAPDSPIRRRHLHNARDSYRLIVVDEAHALRNPDTTWHRAISRMLGGERKDLVLLTATPINNGLWDLYHMVMVFARHDRAFVAHGIPTLRGLFLRAGANERDPENLDPDVLFPLADMVSVRRDRRFIQQHYPGATFPDGTPVRFPEPVLTTERYDLDDAYPDLVLEITVNVGNLSMARYRPSAYRIGEDEDVSEAALGGLLQSGILKRFESCWEACLRTVERMIVAHDAFLEAWDAGFVPSREALRAAAKSEFGDAGLAEWIIETMEDEEALPVGAFHPRYRGDVVRDRDLLVAVGDRLMDLDSASDPKLALLKRLVEESPSEKVIVFSTFADTIRYLDRELPDRVGGRERVTVIGAETDPDARTEMLARFSPETVVRPGYEPPDGEVDLLLSNDVLAEGQNLQQAGAVISYDMPWNPQRVVQRYGRVLRLLSPHDFVYLTTMLPEPGDLEALLELEVTIRRKIVAARPYGMEVDVIEGIEEEIRSYTGRLVAGDSTLLDETDQPDESHAFSGEELRALLQRALAEGEVDRLRRLPWGIGSVFEQGPLSPSIGSTGAFMACRTRSGERYWRFYDADGGLITEEAAMLRRIDPGSAPP
ncbi:MAG: helicase-related protein, partial [Dehalococcoidia bacterium]